MSYALCGATPMYHPALSQGALTLYHVLSEMNRDKKRFEALYKRLAGLLSRAQWYVYSLLLPRNAQWVSLNNELVRSFTQQDWDDAQHHDLLIGKILAALGNVELYYVLAQLVREGKLFVVEHFDTSSSGSLYVGTQRDGSRIVVDNAKFKGDALHKQLPLLWLALTLCVVPQEHATARVVPLFKARVKTVQWTECQADGRCGMAGDWSSITVPS
jgi:hypothetical protein